MSYVASFLLAIVGSCIFWATVVWLTLPYSVPELSNRLPHGGTASRFLLAFGLVLFAGGLLRYVENKMRFSGPNNLTLVYRNISKALNFTGLIVTTAIVVLVAAAFLLPSNTYLRLLTRDHLPVWLFLLVVSYASFRFFGALLMSTRSDAMSRARSIFVGDTADDLLARDHRAPVLYLRSFSAEQKRATFASILEHAKKIRTPEGRYLFSLVPGRTYYGSRSAKRSVFGSTRSMFDEQMIFADVFNKVGPYIAIGRPTEIFRDMDLGAAKEYVSDEEWQDVILHWLCRSAVIVLETGGSEGLIWEISRVVEHVDPLKVVLILPMDDEKYDHFRVATTHVFPVALPQRKPPSRLLILNADWKPIELTNVNLCLGQTLQPFFQRLGIDIHGESYVST
jgi:hypothetical protein